MIKSEAQRVVVSTAVADTTLVAAVATEKIRVLALALVASGGANTLTFESDTGGTALTGDMDLAADGQLILPYNGVGWFETVVGELLNLQLANATLVAGVLVYQEVEP